MPAPNKIKCTATTAASQPCAAWAMSGTTPPRCAAHSGLSGAPKGNTNAVTHGYYQRGISDTELATLFTAAEDVDLTQEAVLIRVVLSRLKNYLLSGDLTPKEILAVAPLIFTGTRALASLQKHLPDPNAIDWDATLDALSEEWGWDI